MEGSKNMEDTEIIELYFSRSESAIAETRAKYDGYLRRIAYNVLANNEDSDECVSDTYLKVWNSIPPNRPAHFPAYLAAIVRNVAVSAFRKRNTLSREGSQYAVSLDELAECISGSETPEQQFESGMISRAISSYLRTLSEDARMMFVCRYYFNDSIADIARIFGAGESKVKSSLFRTRNGLKEYLIKEGIDV